MTTLTHRLPSTLALLCAAAFALGACGGSDPVDEIGSCELIGTVDIGTITATTPQGSFSTSCGIVQTSIGMLGVFARTPSNASPLGGPTIEMLVDGLTEGTYPVGNGDGEASLSYGQTPATTVEATSGSVTITSTAGGFVGTFEFTTATGADVTNGRFALDV